MLSRNAKTVVHVVPQMCIDMVIAFCSFLLAYSLRYRVAPFDLQSIFASRSFEPYVAIILFAPLVRVFTCYMFGIYEVQRRRVQRPDLLSVVKAVALGSVLLVVLSALYRGVLQNRGLSVSRYVLGLDFLLNLFACGGFHTLIWICRDAMRRAGYGLRRIAVQGAGETARTLLSEIDRSPESGYTVVGYIANGVADKTISVGDRSFEWLGGTSPILHTINKYKLDEIVVTNVASLGVDLMAFVDECHKRDVIVKLVPDFYGIILQRHALVNVAGQPVIQINEITIEGFALFLKRVEDLVLSSIFLIMTSPILILTAIAIKLESPGPILFRQERVGKNGVTFTVYKFRSMVADAEQLRAKLDAMNESDGLLFKMKSDPRITKVGKLIRKLSIDELPQLFNVIRGNMSLVGPRPLPVIDVEKTGEWGHRRLSVVPGVTGMWQVNRKDHTTEEMVKWDIFYVENWSLWLDLKILFKTVGVVLTGKGAY
ncbi:MAG: sugar transferase [Candidatus Hydrogenedentes bacterium]|nr:sugar transferase [Candidatus Hydrogenedentota bacterium]